MYVKKQFGKELKDKILKNDDIVTISHWIYSLYLDKNVDDDLNDLFLILSAMADGPEFEYSYEELNDIADRLIAGESVKL